MKRLNIFLILVFMACSCWINSAFAQTVTFPDDSLAEAVKKALRIEETDDILAADLEMLERLTATNKGIDNLTGLERATGLKDLDLGNNVIDDLSPLSNLTLLEELDLADNLIVDVFPLRNLTNLTDLDLDGNQIVNIFDLSSLSSLETLDLTYNSVVDVTSLSALTTLKKLYLRYNDNLIDDLTDSRQLANARQLVKLKAAKVSIDITLPRAVTFRDDNLVTELRSRLGLETDDPIFPVDMETQTFTTFSAPNRSIDNLTGLETAINLTSLNLSGNTISSLTPLAKLVNLETLNLADNENISSISSLAKLTGLTDLDLSNNKISSVSSLSKLTSLTDLNLSMNQISSLTALSDLSSLTTLDLSNNTKIKDVLPLQGLSSLQRLDLFGNTGLTMEKVSVLYTLDQGGTNIILPGGITLPNLADIVRFENAALETAVRSALRITKGYPILLTGEKGLDTLPRLTATRKNIDDLTGLAGATALTSLDLGQNDIVNLTPLQNLTSLTTLDLADNQIDNFSSLSGLTNLTTLDLGQNAIVSVPALSSLTSLVTLDLADNQIQNVSTLSGLSVLETLDLRNNSVEDVTRLSELTTLKKLYLRGNADLIDDLTQPGQLANARALVKLKFGETRTTIDLTLPRAVTFRDDNLVEELRTRLGLGDGDPIFPADMQTQTFTTFSASNQSIVTLTGLETAINLTSLTLDGNAIASLTPLAKLVNLETLNLADNEKISSISSLAKLTSLTDLNLSNNKISSVSSLSKLTSLTDLNLSMNQISSLTSLSGLTSLRSLDLSENRIRDVLPLQGLSSLNSLNLDGNTDLTMEKASVLYTLQQAGTNITLPGTITLPQQANIVVFNNANLAAAVRSALRITKGYPILKGPLADMKDITDLTRLTATRKQIGDLTGLDEAINLTNLDLGQNDIADLTPLVSLTNLETLDLADNAIVDIPTTAPNVSSLTNLDLSGNMIVNLPTDFSGFSGLTSLNLEDNLIVNVSSLTTSSTTLQTLDLRNNKVTDVTPLSTMTHLKRLSLRGNDNLENTKQLVKLKEAKVSIDITLPRPVTFRDDNLVAELRSALNFQDDDPIFPEDMETLTRFSAPSQSIVTLTGLETAINLTSLTLNDNAIASLTPLAKLVNLETLNLSDNSISSISSLSKLTLLTDLDLSDNEKISSVSSLSKLTLLTNLDLSNNRVSSVTSLSGLTSLTDLDLSDNSIRDVLPLQGLSSLTRLDLTGNDNITNAVVLYRLRPQTTILPPDLEVPGPGEVVVFSNTALETAVRSALRLSKGHPIMPGDDEKELGTLTRLTATRKDIDNLTGLEGATALTTLDLGQNNEISDLGPLQNLTALTSLDLADNKIVNLSLLSSLTALTTLNLSGNQITSVSNLPSLTSLERLDLRNNNVGDVTSLSTMTHLKYLYLRNNANLTNIKFLVKLKDAGTRIDITLPRAVNIPDSNLLAALLTQLTDPIVPEDMESLTNLSASNRSISDLTGLETATSLTNLTLSNNNIDDLELLEELTSLTDLNLSNNQIVDVSPLEELASLEGLNLSNNQIEDVAPLVSLTNLTLLRLTGNSGITNPGALYQLDQGGTTIIGVTVPSAVTFTDDALEEAVKKALRIADVDPILPDAIAMLTRLTASRKTITSLSGLETAGILERLDVGQNSISDLGPLSGLMRLEWLDVADNQITDVSPLETVTSLEALDLRNNQITDVEPLTALTSLRQIYIRGNDGITNLEWLATIERLRSDIKLPSVVDIPDTNLDTAVRTALSVIGTLPMSEEMLEELETLTASNRNIADLTGCEHMTDLTSLDLRNNQITDVTPLSKLYSLETLMLNGNTILDTSPLYGLLSRNLNNVDITIYRYPSWDVNQDGDVDKADLYLITLIITGTQQDINGDGTFDADDETAADVNRDGTRNINDLRFVFDYLDRPVNLGAPLLNAETGLLELSMLEQMDADGLRVQLEILRATNDGSLNYQQTVAFLQAILTAIQPNQTVLLANYPNPFNPETWIPYQLARDSHVQVTIYDTQGAIIRRLELGYRAEGFYTTRGKAAHWDGRNEVGERVASGIYFYQLETDDVSLLRKMVILK